MGELNKLVEEGKIKYIWVYQRPQHPPSEDLMLFTPCKLSGHPYLQGTWNWNWVHTYKSFVVQVMSLPEYGNAVGYASVTDYNTQNRPPSQFVNGQSLVASVMDLPASSESGRLLLLLKSTSDAHSSKAKRKASYDIESLVQVTETKSLEIRVKFGANSSGRIHITEVTDEEACEHPFSSFKTGQSVTARIVGKSNKADHSRIKQQWELSLKPSIVMGPANEPDHLNANAFHFSVGQPVTGYVSKVDSEWVWLAVYVYMPKCFVWTVQQILPS